MTGLAEMAKLNQAYNEIQDVLDKHKVELCAGCNPALHGSLGTLLYFEKATRTTAYDESQPPRDYDEFIALATEIFVAKDRDYRSRFMRALLDVQKDPRTVWAWEVEKKLDRIRTWIDTGSLQVKGEGVKDSVIDVFNYTVQYVIYIDLRGKKLDPLKALNERDFFTYASRYTPNDWLNFITVEGLISPVEQKVKRTILKYMGIPNG